jgi:acetoin:2,6-dichlorophenolindophenol oxidoreductase subunit beta
METNVLVEKREIMYREALNEAFAEEMARDNKVFVMGEGIAERGGSYKVTAGLLEQFGAKRVFDTPISENGFTGAGVGAALTGMRPVVEILFVDFSMLILDQIINQAAKFRFMSGNTASVPLVVRTQGGIGNGLAAQHSQSLEAIFYHIPGLRVVMPSTPYDAKGLLKAAIRCDDPVIFIEHKLLYMNKGEVPEEEYVIPLGEADIKKEGADLTIVAWSGMIPKVLEASEILSKAGISAEVVDPRSLVPLDKKTIIKSVKKTEHVLIVQEAVRRGGVGSDISSIIQEEAFDYLDSPVKILGGLNTPCPFNLNLEKLVIPQVDDIVRAAKEVLYTV